MYRHRRFQLKQNVFKAIEIQLALHVLGCSNKHPHHRLTDNSPGNLSSLSVN